jgi:hypothetical protein
MQTEIIKISKKFPINEMFTAEDVKKHIDSNIFLIESNMRAIAKEKPFDIKLACICSDDESPSIGYFNGSAKSKNYFFVRTR